jgi:orotate phosphoribosyltransferase-like protein
MGFKCASLIVDFFLYSYEVDFIQGNHSSGVMVTSLASLVVDREFEKYTSTKHSKYVVNEHLCILIIPVSENFLVESRVVFCTK